jgi:hypothetical protein
VRYSEVAATSVSPQETTIEGREVVELIARIEEVILSIGANRRADLIGWLRKGLDAIEAEYLFLADEDDFRQTNQIRPERHHWRHAG